MLPRRMAVWQSLNNQVPLGNIEAEWRPAGGAGTARSWLSRKNAAQLSAWTARTTIGWTGRDLAPLNALPAEETTSEVAQAFDEAEKESY